FDASMSLRNRERWIKNSQPQGRIAIDEGALAAIRERHSLLPRGLRSCEGRFDRGAVILVTSEGSREGAAKVVTGLSSEEIERVIGLRSEEVEGVLGPGSPKIIARPEETVFLED
ncbi:MAG: PUA domain-containing protein, partial [Spirochaetota bacterium]